MDRVLIQGKPQIFKISKPGFDVKIAGDEDLLLHAGSNPAVIIQTGRFFVNVLPFASIIVYAIPTNGAFPVIEFQTAFDSDEVKIPYNRRANGYQKLQVQQQNGLAIVYAEEAARWVSYVVIAKSIEDPG